MIEKEEVPYFKICQRLGGCKIGDAYISPTKAATYTLLIFLSYLHLVKNCDRSQALHFATKRICKWDSTKVHDGPSGNRILEPKGCDEVHYCVYVERSINGWQNIGLEMFYKNKETLADIRQLGLDEENDIIQKEFEKNENQLKNDFKAKIKVLQDFYQEMNKKYKVNCKDKNFKENLQLMKDQLIQQRLIYCYLRYQPIKYIKYNGVRFIELAKDQDKKESLIEQFQTFSTNQLKNQRVKSKLPSQLFKSDEIKDYVHDDSVYKNIEQQSQAALALIESKDNAWKKSKNHAIDSKAFIFQEDYNRCNYLFNNKITMAKIPEINEHQLILPSQHSIKLGPRARSQQTTEDAFEIKLDRFARKMMNGNTKNQEVQTSNIQTLVTQREKLRSQENNRSRKTRTCHVAQMKQLIPQLSLDKGKRLTECKTVSTNGNSQLRSYIVTPITNRL